MPANLPNSPYSANIQGPDPTGLLGYPLAVVGVAGGTAQTVSIDQTTPGTTNFVNNVPQAFRLAGATYRTGVTSADILAVPTSPSVADVATGGSLLAATTYNVTLAAGTIYGPTTVPANGSVTTAADASNTHVARCTIAQVAGAAWYDLFLSTAANPLWVARVTEAQRAAGCTVTAVGTVTGTSPGAGKVDINVVGTGLASNVAPFNNNNAVTLANCPSIDCTGKSTMQIFAALTVTDLRSLPRLNFAVYQSPIASPATFFQTGNFGPVILNAVRTPLYQGGVAGVFGCAATKIVIVDLAGQGASVDIYYDLF